MGGSNAASNFKENKMQIKNNQTRNAQFFYYRQKEGSKSQELALVHIPGGATVELDDAIPKSM